MWIVSRDAALQECAKHYLDLLPWVPWCYLSPCFVAYYGPANVTIRSAAGDPLSPFLFSLVLHKVAGAMKEDTECNQLLYQAWYLDNGILAGKNLQYVDQLHSLSLHSGSAFIASFCSSGVYDTDGIHLTNALDHFNSHVSPIEKLSVNSVVSSPVSQKLLSSKVNDCCFEGLFDQTYTARLGLYLFQPPCDILVISYSLHIPSSAS